MLCAAPLTWEVLFVSGKMGRNTSSFKTCWSAGWWMTDLLLKLLTSAFIFSSFSLLQSSEFKPCSNLCNASSASLSLFSRSMRTFTSAWGRQWALLKTSLCLNNHPANSQDPWGTHPADENVKTRVRKTNRNIVRQHKSCSACLQTESEIEIHIILVIFLYSDFHFHCFSLIVCGIRGGISIYELKYLQLRRNRKTSFQPRQTWDKGNQFPQRGAQYLVSETPHRKI